VKLKFPFWQVLAIPMLFIALGNISNQAVLIANHGKFPVMVNEAQQMKYEQQSQSLDLPGQFIGDDVHAIMGPNSHLKVLADIFNLDGICSIGDLFLWAGFWLWGYAPIVWVTLLVSKHKN